MCLSVMTGLTRCSVLADPTRRAVVERSAKSPALVSELAAPFPMALPSLLQHQRVPDDSGLITSQKHERARTVNLRPGPSDVLHRWLGEQRTFRRTPSRQARHPPDPHDPEGDLI